MIPKMPYYNAFCSAGIFGYYFFPKPQNSFSCLFYNERGQIIPNEMFTKQVMQEKVELIINEPSSPTSKTKINDCLSLLRYYVRAMATQLIELLQNIQAQISSDY